MILSKEFLDKLEWYEVDQESTYDCIQTIVVLHFKAWWRLRKKIKMRWAFKKRLSDTQTTWQQTQEDVELRQQLKEYFKGRV